MPDVNRRRFLYSAGIASAAGAFASLPAGASSGLATSRDAPISISRVALLARNAAALADWYRNVVGLHLISSDADTTRLGAGGKVLLEIAERPDLTLAMPADAGLYHTAFLLPSRADLAGWVSHASEGRFSIDGASDHEVSEAIYLTDPEGNGVEIYVDRSPDSWTWANGQVVMGSKPLDFQNLMQTSFNPTRGWEGSPDGTIVGHVHMRVGDAEQGAAWWQEQLGLDRVRSRTGAVFLSTGGYHHHIAVNQWQSAGASMRASNTTGLAWIELSSRLHQDSANLADPWGTEIRIARRAA